MAHVDAFTNLPGYHSGEHLSKEMLRRVKYHDGSEYVTTSYTGTQAYSECYKSPTKSGFTSGSWRRPTAYSRCVSRSVSHSSWRMVVTDSVASAEVQAGSAFAYVGLQFQGNPFFGTDGSISVSSDVVGRAEAEALAKISGRKISIGVALGESIKTTEWLARKATQLYEAYRHLRKGRFRDLYNLLMDIRGRRLKKGKKLPPEAKSFIGAPSSWWLQYWYAFTPLVSDVYGLAALVEEGLREKDLLFSVTRTITQPLVPPYLPLSTSHVKEFSRWESGHATESCRVKIWVRVSTTQLASLNQLGLLNPALIAWELVPFSFVVDWILPIGVYLENLSATSGVTFHDGFRTVVVKGRYDAYVGVPAPDDPNLGHWTFVSPARGSWEFYAMSRHPYDDWPTTSLYAISPWSTQRVITAIALILQRR